MKKMKRSVFHEQVDFMLAVTLMGSVALLAIIVLLEASEESNPIADVIADTVYAGELTNR